MSYSTHKVTQLFILEDLATELNLTQLNISAMTAVNTVMVSRTARSLKGESSTLRTLSNFSRPTNEALNEFYLL